MRVCIDTNVLIRYLLDGSLDRPPTRILDHFFHGRFDLTISETTISEFLRKIENKPYRARRIPAEDAQELVTLLRGAGAVAGKLDQPIPAATRDPKDDHLLAHAIAEEVDYLVSGDKDLLALGSILTVRIVGPANFAMLLETLGN